MPLYFKGDVVMKKLTIEYNGVNYDTEITEGTTQFKRTIRVYDPTSKRVNPNGTMSKGIGLLYTWTANSDYKYPRPYDKNVGTVPKAVVMKAFQKLFAKEKVLDAVAITNLEPPTQEVKLRDRFAE